MPYLIDGTVYRSKQAVREFLTEHYENSFGTLYSQTGELWLLVLWASGKGVELNWGVWIAWRRLWVRVRRLKRLVKLEVATVIIDTEKRMIVNAGRRWGKAIRSGGSSEFEHAIQEGIEIGKMNYEHRQKKRKRIG